ncbi:hypothetical protein [Geodermatophilus sp. CPCC 206100]|uniref:hypothetical protein n=1 Tax=Geodermatophilus sp. CPCC 206100 TaxID=3020054 RepID=UPI003AFFEC6F
MRATDFDLARATLSRRSAGQLRSWTVVGDVDAYLDCFTFLGPLPGTELVE